MCLMAWHWQPGSETPLLLLNNRDEYFARPAQALHRWDGDRILAGRDSEGGGTWLGITRGGRLAALTNYRDPALLRAGTPSRSALVTDFLNTELSAHAYLMQVASVAAYYNPFNLLVFDGQRLMGLHSLGARIIECAPGFGAVSNADFDTPWPKLTRLKNGLAELVGSGLATDAALLALLHDETIAPDALLPQTGISLERERILSCAFVAGSDYGTRASSLVQLGRAQADFTETRFHPNAMRTTRRVVWSLFPAAPPARLALQPRPREVQLD